MGSPSDGSILEVLQSAAANWGGSSYLTFDGEYERESYAALLKKAARIHADLRDTGLGRGQPVVLAVQLPSHFFPLFWACQMGGWVPVPLAPPMGLDDDEVLLRIHNISRKLDSPVICEGHTRARLEAGRGEDRPPTLAVEALGQGIPSGSFEPTGGDDIALLQYSSGSTREPKGVMLSHRNLLANLAQFTPHIAFCREDVECDWMPHFHDLGLIGCHLGPMYVGASQVKIMPAHFLMDPQVWFQAASDSRATVLSATNMALRYALRRVQRVEPGRWDLGAVRMFMVGAEPLSPSVLRAFMERMAPTGLPIDAVRHAYGLAEATLGVTVNPATEPTGFHHFRRKSLNFGNRAERVESGDPDGIELADVGVPIGRSEVRIADRGDEPLAENQVGHIQVRGPCVTRGYYQDDEATAAAFSGEWLRTGDVGFLSRERLFVCGRDKELITFAGSNYYPHDIEAIACEEPGIKLAVACSTAATSATDEEVLLFLVPRAHRWQDALDAIIGARHRVQKAMRLAIDRVIPVDKESIPRTSSGKVRRVLLAERTLQGAFDEVVQALERALADHSEVGDAPEPPGGSLRERVTRIWAEVLGLDPTRFGPEVSFSELGGTSVKAFEVLDRIERATGRTLGFAFLEQCATVDQMVAWLTDDRPAPEPARLVGTPAPESSEIAVVGVACRFPDADTSEQFWENIASGRDSAGPIPSDRWSPRALEGVGCRWGSFLQGVYDFDADFFQIPREEAVLIDPQQRLLLVLGYELLEQSGYGTLQRSGHSIGAFVGANQMPHQELLATPGHRTEVFALLRASEAYRALDAAARRALDAAMDDLAAGVPEHPTTMVGNIFNMIASRLSHQLDLSGPSMAIDTACSASLVTIHIACESLRNGECDLAMAGGVNLNLAPPVFKYFDRAGALSHTGRCRSFSKNADGFVPGEGAGLVLLKPLERAQRDGDRIWGVIRGSAVNNDGSSIGAMAPNPRGQLQVLRAAYRRAGVDPATIGLIEAHGTGTAIGDPIELRSLTDFFAEHATGAVALGSVKSNVGHLLGAAGVAGFIKLLLALQHRKLPPTLHCSPEESRLADLDTPLSLQVSLADWEGERPLRGGINAFGFGGTNCHLVLEEPPERVPEEVARTPWHLLALSAPTRSHLEDYAARLSGSLPADARAADVCPELHGRTVFRARCARVLDALDGVRPALQELGAGSGAWARSSLDSGYRPLRLAFLFPGQGSQFPGQSRGLYRYWAPFRERFGALCAHHPGLVEALYGEDANAVQLTRTEVAQPLLVAFQIAMVQALRELGIRPVAVLGHSVGEFAAACAAGVMRPEQALRLAAERGRQMQALPEHGGMLAVLTDEQTLAPVVEPYRETVSLAAFNGPRQVVLSGRSAHLDQIRGDLEQRQIACLPLSVSHGFHSPLMAPMLEGFAAFVREQPLEDLGLAFASTVTGEVHRTGPLPADYWVDHVRTPVRFAQAFSRLQALEVDAFVEVGPGSVLSRLTRDLGPGDPRPVLDLCRGPGTPDPDGDWRRLLEVVADLWTRGARVDLPALAPEAGGGPLLPSVPFRPQTLRFQRMDWSDAPTEDSRSLLHSIGWQHLPSREPHQLPKGTWLLLADAQGIAASLADRIRGHGSRVCLVTRARQFTRTDEDRFEVDPSAPDHYRWLLGALGSEPLAGIVYLWSHDPPQSTEPTPWFQDLLARGPRSLSLLLRAVLDKGQTVPLYVATRDGFSTPHDQEAPDPANASVAALALALYQEHPELRGRVIDVRQDPSEGLFEELRRDGPALVALRGEDRLTRTVMAVPPRHTPPTPIASDEGVYLVLGGSGAVGSAIARHLAERAERPTLILTGRRPAAQLAEQVADLEATGARVAYDRLDLTDAEAVDTLLDRVYAEHDRLDAVVHAVGTTRVGSLARRDLAEMETTLAPKVLGTLNLSRALEHRAVGTVLLVSSVTGSMPWLTRGLADYAAANAFQDAQAVGRHRPDQHWMSLAFTLWHATREVEGARSLLGITPIPEEKALAALDLALGYDERHLLVVVPEDVQRFEGEEAPAPPRSGPTAAPAPAAAPDHTGTPEPLGTPDQLEALLRRLVGEATHTPPEHIDADAPFLTLGITSLAAVDMVKELEWHTGTELTTTLLFEHDTLGKLLRHLSDTLALKEESRPRTPPAPTEQDRLPLLPSQKTFYANQSFFPDMPCYVCLRVEVAGALSEEHLNRAIAQLVERHTALRMVFRWEGGELVQRSVDQPPPRVDWRDWRAQAAESHPDRTARLEEEQRNAVFDLAAGPLFRVVVCQLADDRFCLIFDIHHIAADAWSTQLLVGELLLLHEQLAEGRDPTLPPLRSDLFQCTRALLDTADGEDARQSEAYWREVLRDPPSLLALPWDGDPRAESGGRCKVHQALLASAPTALLHKRARQLEVTPFHLLFASYLLALQRWSGQDDIVVRVANARREVRVADIERVVGSFADSLPIRVDVGRCDSLEALAHAVREACVGAQRNPLTSSLTLAGVGGRDHLGPRGVSAAGLSFLEFPAPRHLGGLTVRSMGGGSASGFTQLGLIAWEFADQLHLSWNYLDGLFEPDTIERLAAEHRAMLEQLVRTGSESPASIPPGAVVHRRILDQIERSADRPAIVFGDERTSYRALGHELRALAAALLEAGPPPLVGILAHPGPRAITSLLGILASGAAYVPIDPNYPDARIVQIARQARLSTMVCTADLLDRLDRIAPQIGLDRVFLLDDPPDGGAETKTIPWSAITATAPPESLPEVSPEDLAYVMFTSGTTGTPKGVMVTHRAVSLFHDWVHQAFGVSARDRFIQTSSLSFGGSIRQVFSPLLAGATVYPAPLGLTRDPVALIDFLEEHRITIWNSVPTLWMKLLEFVHILGEQGREVTLPDLRWILIGGENVPADLVRRWMDRFGTRHRIANLYGSTETVVNATWHQVTTPPGDRETSTPIGTARPGSEVYLVDGDPCRRSQPRARIPRRPQANSGRLRGPPRGRGTGVPDRRPGGDGRTGGRDLPGATRPPGPGPGQPGGVAGGGERALLAPRGRGGRGDRAHRRRTAVAGRLRRAHQRRNRPRCAPVPPLRPAPRVHAPPSVRASRPAPAHRRGQDRPRRAGAELLPSRRPLRTTPEQHRGEAGPDLVRGPGRGAGRPHRRLLRPRRRLHPRADRAGAIAAPGPGAPPPDHPVRGADHPRTGGADRRPGTGERRANAPGREADRPGRIGALPPHRAPGGVPPRAAAQARPVPQLVRRGAGHRRSPPAQPAARLRPMRGAAPDAPHRVRHRGRHHPPGGPSDPALPPGSRRRGGNARAGATGPPGAPVRGGVAAGLRLGARAPAPPAHRPSRFGVLVLVHHRPPRHRRRTEHLRARDRAVAALRRAPGRPTPPAAAPARLLPGRGRPPACRRGHTRTDARLVGVRIRHAVAARPSGSPGAGNRSDQQRPNPDPRPEPAVTRLGQRPAPQPVHLLPHPVVPHPEEAKRCFRPGGGCRHQRPRPPHHGHRPDVRVLRHRAPRPDPPRGPHLR
jgi:acyl transferase domain-containing protein/acyl-CoA synthetase (AMP-forming)/AMP-acid ligase II/acyl carrier protein